LDGPSKSSPSQPSYQRSNYSSCASNPPSQPGSPVLAPKDLASVMREDEEILLPAPLEAGLSSSSNTLEISKPDEFATVSKPMPITEILTAKATSPSETLTAKATSPSETLTAKTTPHSETFTAQTTPHSETFTEKTTSLSEVLTAKAISPSQTSNTSVSPSNHSLTLPITPFDENFNEGTPPTEESFFTRSYFNNSNITDRSNSKDIVTVTVNTTRYSKPQRPTRMATNSQTQNNQGVTTVPRQGQRSSIELFIS